MKCPKNRYFYAPTATYARGGRIAAGGGLFAGGGGLFAGGPFAAGLIAGGPFASGLNAAHQRSIGPVFNDRMLAHRSSAQLFASR